MLTRLNELAANRQDFAFETTLASRTFAPWIGGLRKSGYQFHLAFVWLDENEMAVRRVAARVRSGGHHVPEDTVRRRYGRGLLNFFELYRPLADSWILYDNSSLNGPRPVASQEGTAVMDIVEPVSWQAVLRAYEHAKQQRENKNDT